MRLAEPAKQPGGRKLPDAAALGQRNQRVRAKRSLTHDRARKQRRDRISDPAFRYAGCSATPPKRKAATKARNTVGKSSCVKRTWRAPLRSKPGISST